MTIRVVVADHHEVVRWGIRSFLRGTDVEIVAEAASGQQAIDLASEWRPDILLLDVRLPGVDGLSAMETLRDQGLAIRFVVFTAFDNPTYIARSVAAGASEYLLKSASQQQLLAAIRGASRGDPPLDGSLLVQVRRVMNRRHKGQRDEIPLTNRELQVLRHVALGLSNREIGRALEISIETVKEHVQNMLRKLNVNDRTQAAVWAVRRGLV